MSYRILRVLVLVAAAILPLQIAPVVKGAASTASITAITAGDGHACAVGSDGAAWCWGGNANGELGDGTTTERHGPVRVTKAGGGSLTAITAISAGLDHTCAVTSDGMAWCWGANGGGELGDGTTTERLRASQVTRTDGGILTGVTAITATGWFSGPRSVSDHSCAVTSDGAAWCWGANDFGQLGDGTTIDRLRAVRVKRAGGRNLEGVTAISGGGFHSCARTREGAAWCWGDNTEGELGDGTTIERHLAVRVTRAGGGTLNEVSAISAVGSTGIIGFFRACAVTSDGAAWCWGGNYFGELGDDTTTERHRAVRVITAGGRNLTGVSAISAGANHTCALTRVGAVKCWGDVYFRGLGPDLSTTERQLALRATSDGGRNLTGVSAIAAGDTYTCALIRGGAKCWGFNGSGQLGDGTTTNSVTPVDALGLVSQPPPLTDSVDSALSERQSPLPLLPLFAGLAGGLAMLRWTTRQGGGRRLRSGAFE